VLKFLSSVCPPCRILAVQAALDVDSTGG